jgi:hypothetical protein
MTGQAPTVVRTITADEIRDVARYYRQVVTHTLERDSYFSFFVPLANLLEMNFLMDGTLEVVMAKETT